MPSNGRLDTSTLTKVDGWAYLAPNTAAAWNAACDEMVKLGYPRPAITAPDGAYRTYAQQVYWKAYWTARGKPGNAATPGYSNHGWGTAVDIFGVAVFPRDVLRAVFARHGFTFNVPSESWHAQHDGSNTGPSGGGSTPIGEDFLSNLTPEEQRDFYNKTKSIYSAIFDINVDDFAKRPTGLGRAVSDIRTDARNVTNAIFEIPIENFKGRAGGIGRAIRDICVTLGIIK